MPEEINRVLTDQIAELLFTTEASARSNLLREGISADRIYFVGNVMIDTLLAHRDRARALDARRRYGLNGSYAILTLHRPTNVDDPVVFEGLMLSIGEIAREMPVVFPVHPRTRPAVLKSETASRLVEAGGLRLLDPLGYLEFLSLMEHSRVVLTDSGGIQEETTILGVPCLTLRQNTERPVTVTDGTNRVVGTEPARIIEGWREVRRNQLPRKIPPLWDGQAARRIVDVLRGFAT
jgi:UDP-N-acetylglucosamine 2-epimerase (non-hydrolysing)